jgi:3-carboxy-cis,cis-muconate cycloisomerase
MLLAARKENQAVRLIESSITTTKIAEPFSDRSILEAMLAFEVGLARVEAGLGVIPVPAARAIEKAASPQLYEADALAADSLHSATVSIPFVKALTEQVKQIDPAAAGFVHWGATSQDLADTAIILVLQKSRDILEADLMRLERALSRLSERHAGTVMLGRTLLQAALPTTFGLKVAGWLGAIRRNHARLDAAFEEAMILQFGGAAGTLASLGDQGIAVGKALAAELGIGYAEGPWHTHRDRLAALMCALGVLAGSLGKMARDISLLSQNEVAEAAEPTAEGRGGSSAMPHKQNPVGSTLALSAAYRVPGLVSTFLSSMVQEHERALGGWQSEWATISAIVQAASLAATSMADVAEGLTVNAARMRKNIDATHGTIFAERATLLLAKKLGRDAARKVVEQAVQQSAGSNRDFVNVLAEIPEAKNVMDASTVTDLQSPEAYLGVAEQLRRSLVKPKASNHPPHSAKRKR